MTVALAPAVRAHGAVYLPVPNDRWNGDPDACWCRRRRSSSRSATRSARHQLVLTDEQGIYRFAALPTGAYSISARNNNGDQLASAGGALVGPDGNDNLVPPMILDAGPPRLLSIAPPPGFEGRVAHRRRRAGLLRAAPARRAAGQLRQPRHPYFQLRSASGTWPPGTWTSMLDADRHQVVRFIPQRAVRELRHLQPRSSPAAPAACATASGRPLTPSGNVGSNFKTSDGVGPSVIRTEPDLGAAGRSRGHRSASTSARRCTPPTSSSTAT